MEKKRSNAVPFIFAVLLSLPPVYVGCYFALLDPIAIEYEDEFGQPVVRQLENYRLLGTLGRTVFFPLHGIDRSIRPDHWEQGFEVAPGGGVRPTPN